MAAPRQRAYCSVYGCLNSSKIKPTLLSFFKLPTDAERHSVDSVASYSSQNHVDRIRTQNFSAASCQDEDFSSIKTSFFRRSLSNLECSNKRPESVTSNTSTTKSHYRELVERKSSQDEHKSVTNAVGDIQYFEIPTENLEFDKPRNSLEKKQEERLKKRKLSKSTVKDKEKELCENKAKKHEKYQSKLADYYKLPAQLPQDEFYQHLTRSKAAEDLLQKRSPNLDTKFSGSYGRLWKHKEPEGSNLRRSRSLAVIREETFTDLHIQNHVKNKRSQLIPRARLFDKPCFKDRLIGHAKYQTKEEVLQSIYIESTASCFGEINAQRDNDKTIVHTENKSLKEDAASRESSHYTKSVSGSWPNLNEKNKQTHLYKDSNGHSCNPSDIDSLDSNYVRKHYNFEAHCKSFRSSSPDTERSFISMNQSKDLYGTTDDHETDNEDQSRSINNTAKYFTNDSLSMTHSDITKSELAESENITDDEVSIQSKHSERKENIQEETITKNCEVGDGEENQSVVSGNDGTVSSPPDSITSYISISIASSAGKSHKLEYLAHSLAEKIDAYCDSQFKEKVSVAPNTLGFENNHPDGDSIYTKVNKKKIFADIRRDSFLNKKGNENIYNEIKKNSNKKVYVSNTYIESDTYSVKSHCTPNRNITTEPFETTLIENQYYSLPDINIGKCLRKSERIDAQLREEDPENVPCENNYKIAQTHFRHILSNKRSENYGQLNKTTNNNFQVNSNPSVIEEAKIVESFTKIEDDLKSIVTIDTSNPDDKDPHFYCSDTLQNERELNDIEGTIRNNKLITKSENLKITNTVYKPEIYTIKSLSNDNINKCMQEKKACFGIRKHYSLRQRDPTDDEIQRLPSPKTIQRNLGKPLDTVIKIPQIKEVKTPLLSRVQSFKTAADSSIAIVPLSGHQTIVIDPPLTQKTKEIKASAVAFTAQETRPAINQLLNTKVELSKKKSEPVFEKKKETKENKITIFPIDTSSYYTPKEPFITIKLNKVVKTTIPKLKSCEKFTYTQNKFERPPPKLIIEDNKSNSPAPTINKSDTSMTRPQVLQVMDSQNKKQTTLVNMDKNKEINTNGLTDNTKLEPNPETKQDIKEPKNEMSVREKLNNVIKTDKQYQEKINSVKSYWSRLVDKAPETQQPTKILGTKIKHEEENTNDQSELEKEVKKEIQAEEEKSSPDISVGSIIKSLEGVTIVDSIRKISLTKLQLWKDETEKVKSDSEMKETTLKKKNKQSDGNFYEKLKPKKINFDMCRDSPEIEIVELSSNDNHSQKTQATLIKAKGYENGNDDFDHVRYKVMKSELFKNSMIANYRKEAQFDGLLQYLQDYSFQELLVNNNIVIIEPVRTKIEPPRRNITVTSKIPQTPLKKADINCGQINRSKNAIRRHFFYHPIRVNKEIIEEELPNPDTVKKVRNLFEDTLKMKTFMTQDHLLIDDLGLTRRASSYRNLNGDSKGKKIEGRRNVIRHLTIDTNFGNKKWDNASLSSGISSGDFGSNNEYDNEGLSPYSKNVMDVYSSSDEYLCDPMSQDFCCESQYVSPDILKKIRERGTSITYYGGKVLNSIPGSNVSPMTNTIMEEIKSLKKNCNRDCYSCQTKCRGDKCSCLIENKHKQYRIVSDIQKATATGDMSNQDKNKYTDGFPGFKFKLVKSNSCSSRLELTGTHESKSGRLKYKKSPKTDDLPLLYDDENSVKNKICKLESYNEGILKTPFKSKDGAKINALSKNVIEMYETSGIKCKNELSQRNASLSETEIKLQNQAKNIAQTDNSTNDANTFEKKFYYLNENLDQGKVTTGKFGDMVFEEFEVLESCYDSLNSNYSLK